MSNSATRTLAGVLAAGLILGGCTSDPEPGGSTSPDTSTSASASSEPSSEPSASVSPSPSSTLTAEEQQAFEEATAVVLAYRQTLVDLYSGATTQLNELNRVATGELLDRSLARTQQDLGAGIRSEPQGVQLLLVSAEPVSVNLMDDPNVVVVRACIDGTPATRITADGARTDGIRERADYSVVRTTYLPASGWAVARTQVAKDPLDRTC